MIKYETTGQTINPSVKKKLRDYLAKTIIFFAFI